MELHCVLLVTKENQISLPLRGLVFEKPSGKLEAELKQQKKCNLKMKLVESFWRSADSELG